jgi:hypothetical protein
MKMVQNEDPSFGTPSTGMPKIKTTNNHPYPQFSTFPRNPGTPEPRNPGTPEPRNPKNPKNPKKKNFHFYCNHSKLYKLSSTNKNQ